MAANSLLPSVLQTNRASEPRTDLIPFTADDLNGLNRAVFEWADSYDKKDWERLARNSSPQLHVDYTGIGLECWPDMSNAEYVAMCSDHTFLGNQSVVTQHLIGGTYFTKLQEDLAEGRHQLRAAHQVYTDDTRKTIKLSGHALASNVHWYRKIDGVWKFAGIRPHVLWSEGDFDGVWTAAREAAALGNLGASL